MTGLLNVLKAPGYTSHDVVNRLRRLTGIKRIGHAGTLDPQAAGVLPVCIGNATRMIQYLDHRQKVYRVEMKLGLTTDSQDLTGRILSTSDMLPDHETVKRMMASFEGIYWQVPPMYSAIKKDGRKLYELAREGTEIERIPRKKKIYKIQWISMEHDLIQFDVTCSEGTYVRTLCHDAGLKLGCGAAMSFLLRLESCGQIIRDAFTLDELEQMTDWQSAVTPVDHALLHHPEVHIREPFIKKALNGIPVEQFDLIETVASKTDPEKDEYLVRVYIDRQFIGMGSVRNESGTLTIKKRIVS
jgi:tRNA pseudouridine55 synthase